MVPNDWMHPAITKCRRQPCNGVLLSAWKSLPPAPRESSLPLNAFQRKLETPFHAPTFSGALLRRQYQQNTTEAF